MVLIAVLLQSGDFERGMALLGQGQSKAAAELFSRATVARPQDARAWKALGVAHATSGDYEAAEPAFARACALAPRLEDACYYHGRALYALNRFEASLEALKKAARGAKVDLGEAQALEALGRAAEAERAFQRALGGDPAAPGAYGLFLVRQGRVDEAIPVLQSAVEKAPRMPEPRVYLGRALLEKGRIAEAAASLEQAIALAPNHGQAHLLLAKAYVRLGRAAEAQPHFEAAAAAERFAQGAR